MSFSTYWRACAFASLLCLGAAPAARAQFAAAITPPRFEIATRPGEVARQIFEITHAAPGSGTYRVYTTDWTMDESGSLTFYDPLQPGSCRPWVALERREVTVAMGARVRFRFEVNPPATTIAQECRFAIMLESKPQDVQAATSTFPMSGRIGVIVYVRVGDAKASLDIAADGADVFDGKTAPMLRVQNKGNATARLAGILKATDAGGASFEMTPDAVPILPGQTRRVALQAFEPQAAARAASAPARAIRWPVTVRGTFEYEQGAARLDAELTFADRRTP